MTKIDIVSGFLGAGKTTLIKKLLAEAYKGEKLVLIENEFGEINIDGGFLKESGVQISEMSAGCSRRDTITLSRPGSARPIEAQVRLPITTGEPIVVFLKKAKSSGMRQSSLFSAPMTPVRAAAAISSIMVEGSARNLGVNRI